MKARRSWKLVIAVLSVTAMLIAAPAHAWFIDMHVGVHPEDAYIELAGPIAAGQTQLVGQSLGVFSLSGVGTPIEKPIYFFPEPGARLNFHTGNLLSWSSAGWTFAGGENSFIEVTWGEKTLLQGYFQDAAVDVLNNTSEGYYSIAKASFLDIKDPELLAYFGLGAYEGQYLQGNFNISFYLDGRAPNAFHVDHDDIISGDVSNTAVPEPGTLLLLGFGLAGLGLTLRRKS